MNEEKKLKVVLSCDVNSGQEKERIRGRGRDHTRAHMPSINQDAHFL